MDLQRTSLLIEAGPPESYDELRAAGHSPGLARHIVKTQKARERARERELRRREAMSPTEREAEKAENRRRSELGMRQAAGERRSSEKQTAGNPWVSVASSLMRGANLTEADERFRELERRWRETGSPEDRAAYARASARTGRHHEFMSPFAKEFHSALNALSNAKPDEMGEEGHIRKRFDKAREEMHKAAKEMGPHENPGHYLPSGNKKWESHKPDYHSHAWELAHLHKHGGGGYSGSTFSFPTPEQRDAFLSSLHHHHGDKGHALGTSEMHLKPPRFIEGSHYVAHYKTPAQVRAGQTLPADAKPWAPKGQSS